MIKNRMCFIIAAIRCNKDVLGTLRSCVLFLNENPTKMKCGIACISVYSQRNVL